MVRVGIFGSENSHAMAFSRLLNAEGETRFGGMRVVAVGGEDEESTRKIMEECGVPMRAGSPAEMIGHIDAAMVTSRHGGLHLGYAKPFIEAGLTTFVDKPVTCLPSEAVELVEFARARRVPLTGGSSTKLVPEVVAMGRERAAARTLGGAVWAPVNMKNPYGDFYFYSAHLVEICLEIFGTDPRSAHALARDGSVTAVLRYPDYDVTCQYYEQHYSYGAALHTSEGTRHETFSMDDSYRLELLRFANMVATGEMPADYDALIRSVFVVEAIKRAYETGERVDIDSVG